MPIYPTICPKCHADHEFFVKMSEYDDWISIVKCDFCDDQLLKRVYTPHSVGHKVSNNQLRVPVNLYDYAPDGSLKVTRIGQKKDVENE